MITINPLDRLSAWIDEEREFGNSFAHGAVLGTQGEDGMPHTRMLGVSFNRQKVPKFHTSPTSRKVQDLSCHNVASLTFAFQRRMRSVSLDGFLTPLAEEELIDDWKKLEREFQKNYLVFGNRSGEKIHTLQELHSQRDLLLNGAEESRPISFIGYKFEIIQRISFYSVIESDFAHHDLYEFDSITQCWIYSLRVP